MSEMTVSCPNCSAEIKLTESLAAPLIASTRQQFETRIAQLASEYREKEQMLAERQQSLNEAEVEFETRMSAALAAERAKIAAAEAEKAKRAEAGNLAARDQEIAELKDVMQRQTEKLAEAQQAQTEFLRKTRELDDAKREVELSIEKRVQAKISEERGKAKQEAEEGMRLKVVEKEQQIAGMQRQIEELKRRAEQGSQQLQGEVLELELEEALRARFPMDIIEPVAKGESGADVLQRVVGPAGQPCGAILWEVKRTKSWSDGWVAKLKADQRSAKIELAVIVTRARPKEIEAFGHWDGVWVTEPRLATALAIALRSTLVEVASIKVAKDGQQTKMELIYDYLTSPKFRHRIEAIVEKFTELRGDLEKERKAMTRLWAKREAQIDSVIETTVGMYGDLQGIAGRAIAEIEGLQLPMIEQDPPDLL